MALSSTELLEKPLIRAALTALLLSIGVLGVVDLGWRLQGAAPQLSDCMSEGLDCTGTSFLIGGHVVVQETEDLAVRVLSRDVVVLEAWPEGLPYPAAGESVSVQGTYRSDGRLKVNKAALYPLSSVDTWLGVLAVVLWAAALIAFARKRWHEARNDG